MKYSITGCPGEYGEMKVFHTVRHRKRVMVIDHVYAEVSTVCGDVLLKPETVLRLERFLREPTPSSKTIPLYDYS